MPRFDEIECYFRGLWLLLMGRLEGFGWLDFSRRGFWRSWWAVVFCLPPMMLSWAGLRIYYLASMPPGTSAGPLFIAKLMVVDASGWVFSYLALAVVMSVSGYLFHTGPVITAVNWLSVPIQWLMVFSSLTEIMAPRNSDLMLSVTLTLLIVSAFAHFMVIRQLVDRKALPASAFLLTMVVANIWSTSVVSNALGIWPS